MGTSRETRSWLSLAIASTAMFLTIVDLWAVTIAYPALQQAFHANVAQVSWVLDAYSILVAALLIPAGRLADVVGRKPSFLAGLVVFGVASLACALAPSLAALVAARAAQAAAAAVLMPTSLGFAVAAFPPAKRGLAVSIWAAVGAFAASSGPVVGGALVTLSWRWIFLINLPLVAAGFFAGAAYLPDEVTSSTSGRIDGWGAALAFASMSAVCAALVDVRQWPAPVLVITFAAGLGLAAAFVRHVARHPDPIVSPSLFREPWFDAGAKAILAYYVGFSAMLLDATLLLTEAWHYSVLDAAIAIAPGPLVSGIVAPFTGRYAERPGVRRAMLGGTAAFVAAGAWPLWMAGSTARYARVLLPALVLWGLANGVLQPCLFATAQTVPARHLGSGSAVLSMSRQLASALGVALLVAVVGDATLEGLRRGWLIVIVSGIVTAAVIARSDAPTAQGSVPTTSDDVG